MSGKLAGGRERGAEEAENCHRLEFDARSMRPWPLNYYIPPEPISSHGNDKIRNHIEVTQKNVFVLDEEYKHEI
jgi:hypothetical protein